MAVKPVLLVPDPRLKQPCAPVEHIDDAVRELIQDLEDTMAAGPGSVGVAACQIGTMLRVALVDTRSHRKFGPASQGHFVLINPVILAKSGERMGREGCMSLPDFTANVRRSMDVTIRYTDVDGVIHTVECTDFEAVAMQHEIDHLDGILFLDRVANLATDVFPRKQK